MMKKKKTGRRVLSFLLTLAMVVGLMLGTSLTANAAAPSRLTLNVGENGKVVMSSGIYGNGEDNHLELTSNIDNQGKMILANGFCMTVHEGANLNILKPGNISFYPAVNNTGTITAVPADGYAFAGWYNGETLYSNNAELEYKNISEDLELTAQFASPALTPVVSDFTYSAPSDLTYDGNAKAATVVAKESVTGMGQVTVKYYSDAECTTEVQNTRNAGTYYVGITVAEGDSYNAVTSVLHDSSWQFTIGKATPTADDFNFAAPSNLSYDGTDKTATVMPSGLVDGMGEVTVKYYSDAECTTEVQNTRNAGTYYVGITVAEGDNYSAVSSVLHDSSWQFTIGKATPTADDFNFTAPSNLSYDGTDKTATVTPSGLVDGMGEVTVKYYSDAECTAEVQNTRNAGTYYVGITVAEGDSYSAITSVLHDSSWQFTIGKATPTADDFNFAAPSNLSYDGTDKTATVTPSGLVDGMGQVTVKYYSDAECTTEVQNTRNAGTYYVGITVAEGDNYSAVSSVLHDSSWKFTIGKATPTADDFTFNEPENLSYDGTDKTATVVPKSGVIGMGNVTVKYYSDAACTTEVQNMRSAGTYYVGIAVDEGDNYNTITSVLHDSSWQFTIGKASATVTEATTAKTLTYNGSTQELVTAGKATGGTLMYRLGTDGKWQQDIPEATDAGTYKIYYYIKGDDNHKDDGSEKEPKGSVETTIKKAAQDKPTETFATTEASDDKTADGKISGLDKAKTYQYSADDGKTWTDVKAGSTEIVVKSGTYQIRYAEDKNHEAGKAASVTVTAKVAPSPEPAKTNATINLKSVTQKNNKVQISWTKVNEADGYDVYVQYCGSKAKKVAKTIKGNSTTKTSVAKINGKKINQKKNFHVKVYAYKMVNGKKKIIAKTITAHLAGTKSVKYTNPKALKLTKSTYSIKVGKTAKIKAKVTLKNSKKKLLPKSHAAKLRYKSSNTKIATVNKNGTIKGKKKGTCYIYVYTVNGLMKKVKVTVK